MSKAETFSFPSYRNLYRHLGETDAMVELTELAARYFLCAANESGNIQTFLESVIEKHRVCVNLAEVQTLSLHLSRSYIVIVASAVERFLKEFRKEHSTLYQKNWTGDADGKDRLDLVFENIIGSKAEAENHIGIDLISRFQYYRNVRNWIVHGKMSSAEELQLKFNAIIPYTREHQKEFQSLAAPNEPVKLTFDDFILFSRLAKTIAGVCCQIAKPKLDDLTRLLSRQDWTKYKKLSTNPQRMKNAVAGKIKTDYGVDTPTADWIAQELCDSLA